MHFNAMTMQPVGDKAVKIRRGLQGGSYRQVLPKHQAGKALKLTPPGQRIKTSCTCLATSIATRRRSEVVLWVIVVMPPSVIWEYHQ